MFVYIVRCSDGSLYTGSAIDVEERIKLHNSGRGAKYTRGRGPVALVYSEDAGSRGDALKREAEIKRLSRKQKEKLFS
jgi:predicted GIY-YIG superfamily endonuclease